MNTKLNGKVALITGASKGIGAAIAKALAAEGAAVVVNYARGLEDAERVVAEIVARDGKAVAVQADMAQPDDVKRLFAEVKRHFGRLDVLVNNAGVYHFDPLEAVTTNEFHRQYGVNVLGPILASQEALKYFGAEGGSIINVSSVVSDIAMPNAVVYASTKGALDTVTRVLAKELGPRRIRVNTIAPGGVDTEGTKSAGIVGSDFEKQVIARTTLGRMGQPSDIAPVAVFLASDASQWLTGERLVVSGGFA
ncbi:MAG: SDR family NAD(P)-dependent oxidoreductase [Myxococcota bacterium]